MEKLVEKYPLEKRKPLKKTILKYFWYLIVLIVALVYLYISVAIKRTTIEQANAFTKIILSPKFLIIFSVIVLILTYIYEIFYLKYYSYNLSENTLIVKKGVFTRNEINLPLNRLQDVHVDQDILDRIFGLYDLHVSSATMISGRLSHIDGLNKTNSEAIKKLIMDDIHKENE